MTKPDDIDQDAWEKAVRASDEEVYEMIEELRAAAAVVDGPIEALYSDASHLLFGLMRERDEAWRDLSAISSAIGSVRWMDPPDGGDVSLAEQVRRMRTHLEATERRLSVLTSTSDLQGNPIWVSGPDLTDDEIQSWIDDLVAEPAKNALRELLAIRNRP